MKADPLEALLTRMRAGDLEAAEEVFLAHEALLRLIVRRRLSQRLRAKFDSLDVVQSVWVRVLRDVRQGGCHIDSTAHLRNFLVQVAHNCMTDRLRRYRRALECEEPLADDGKAHTAASVQPRPSEEAQASELWQDLLANCPPEYHEVLQLKRQGLPLASIAARTGLHEGSVRRILRQLARQVAFR
jgi:RNA polymerase sigma-70 factor (ECF subfamily)